MTTPAGEGPSAATRTVLAGCSFAGLEYLYRTVRRRGRFAPGAMTVVDPRPIHSYVPLAHEVTGGVRDAEELRFDAAGFCKAIGAEWMQGAVSTLDREKQVVGLADGRSVPYDRLVIAIGSVPNLPEPFARSPAVIPAKFVDDAAALRRRLHVLRVSGASVLRVVVVGGGITGVEWSAELASGRVDGSRVATTLVCDTSRLLPTFARSVSQRAAAELSSNGVELLLGRHATGLSRDHVLLEGGTAVPCDVVVWAGGVRPHPVVATFGLPVTADGHLIVNARLEVEGDPAIRAIGDCVRVVEGGREWPTTMRAIEAIWQGAALARLMDPDPKRVPKPHKLHRDFSYGISLGRRRAAIVNGRFILGGRAVVAFRRLLQWGYYRRMQRVAAMPNERAPRQQMSP
ncbi:MAG TPA: FAD-dependent oxidoreductase [Gemmatimonadaceae bacterium]|nr:FAD-dependent oxidoreductase [Gemmatimonadaceae bacterium]